MKRTGEILKKAREEKRLSLHEVALFLKINSRVLQAIEEGDQSQLPARTFLRGFIQSYAKFLKLDAQAVLQIFSEETSPPPPQTTPTNTPPPTSSDESNHLETTNEERARAEESRQAEEKMEIDVINLEKSILTQSQVAQDKLSYKTIAVSIIGLILVGVLYFANSVIKKYQKEAEIEPVDSISALEHEETSSSPIADTTPSTDSKLVSKSDPAQSTGVSSSTPPAESAPTAITPVHPSPTPTPPSANTQTQTGVAMTAPTATIQAKPKLPEKPEVKPIEKPVAQKPVTTPPTASQPVEKPVTAATPPPPAEKEASKPEGKPIEVIVEAHGAVEIEYSSAKTSPQKMSLKADQIHTFKSRSGVRLKISNGGAVNIIMNGRDLGVPGAAGQPVQVTY